ncbi:MAG: DUF6498-containing protein [Verrucomicrobiales bacterium]
MKTNLLRIDASVVGLVLANIFPLMAVFLGWADAGTVLILYWAENIVVGAFNVLKMGTNLHGTQTEQLKKFGLIPFFMVHYGIFCLVHGMFVALAVSSLRSGGGLFGMSHEFPLLALLRNFDWFVLTGLLGLTLSHGFSFFYNYIGKNEIRTMSIDGLMIAPYGRIVVLHVALLLGFFVLMFLGTPLLFLVLLMVGKTLLDISLHNANHAAAQKQEVLTTVEVSQQVE